MNLIAFREAICAVVWLLTIVMASAIFGLLLMSGA